MTLMMEPPAAVEVASDEELLASAHAALEWCGYSFEELREQARSGHFVTARAKLAWVSVGDLGDLLT